MTRTGVSLDDLTQTQRERLTYVDFCLYFHGSVSRSDLVRRFGIAVAAASRDLAFYRGLAPVNMAYDSSERAYRIQRSFKPLNPFRIDRVLSWLRQGFGDGLELEIERSIEADAAVLLAPPSIEMLGTLARAMSAHQALSIRYLSLSSGSSIRDLVPLAFVDNGLRWHVRAFDRKNGRFGDFVVNRIVSAKRSSVDPQKHESLACDEQWNHTIRMEIVPHPGIEYPAAVEADYGMKRGVLIVASRAAIAGYALARWNVDASKNHSLSPLRHHLWLRNGEVLTGLASATLAPGYTSAAREDA